MKEKSVYKIIWLMFFVTLLGEIFKINLIVPKLFIFALCFISCPKNNLLKLFIIFNVFSSGILLYILNIMFFVIYVVRNKGKIKLHGNGKLLALFGLYELLHIWLIMFYHLPISAILEQIMCAINFLGFAFLLSDCEGRKDSKELIKCFVMASIFSITILLIKKIDYYGIETVLKLVNGIGKIPTDSYYSLVFNANSVSRKMCFTLILLFNLYYSRQLTKFKFILGVIWCLFLGIMTYSLSFLIFTTVTAILIILYNIGKKMKKKSILIFCFIFIIICLVLFTLSKTDFYQKIYNIFYKSITADDVSNGRFDVYKYYIGIIINDARVLLFGNGLTTYQSILSNGVIEKAVHNSFLEIILAWGIPGTLTFLMYLFILFNNSFKLKNRITIILIVCLLMYMMIGNFFLGYYSNLLLLLMVHISMNLNKEENKNGEKSIK